MRFCLSKRILSDGILYGAGTRGGLDGDGGFVALDVGGDGPRAHVGLVAQDGIPHVVVVGHLHPVEEDAVLQLGGVAHHATLPDEGRAADEGAMPNLGILPDDGGGSDIGRRGYRGGLSDPDALGGVVIAGGVKGRADLADDRGDIGEDLPGVLGMLQPGAGEGVGEVEEGLGAERDDMVWHDWLLWVVFQIWVYRIV